MKTALFIDLRLFDGLNTNTTETSGLELEAKTKEYYSKLLIESTKPNLVHEQFAQKRNIPKRSSKKIEFRKFSGLPKALNPLTEGVTPDGQSLSVSKVEAEVKQYGGYITESDVLQTVAIDDTIVQDTKALANQAAKTRDTIVRDTLATNANVIYAGGAESRSAMTKTSKLTVDDVYKAVRFLKAQDAPKINGDYIAIIHPDCSYDIQRDNEWIEAHKYADAEKLFNGEIGKIAGCRFIESTEAKIWDNTNAASEDPVPDIGTSSAHKYLAVYGVTILGADAYAVTEIDGFGLEHIVKGLGSGGTADPLNQRSTVGWKSAMTSCILSPEKMTRIECVSSFSDTAKAN